MSVLIKGMEMPKSENESVLLILKPYEVEIAKLFGKPETFEAIEVPTPHGRLIDGDELKARVKQTMRYFSIKFDIDESPTVIEAEE